MRCCLVVESYTLKLKRKDGSFVNDAEKAIAEQIEVGLTQSTTNESKVFPNDVIGRVLGPEHSGRVRCMVAPEVHQFRIPGSNHLGCTKGLHDNEGRKDPDELAVFFDPQPQQIGDADEPESPLGTRGSSGASNI
ncbi:hypothetical protein SESBI_01863 [Sesbania bispinosa]|nr:hypothetical protein SESBI_01863 [Sesbania bispinosa]